MACAAAARLRLILGLAALGIVGCGGDPIWHDHDQRVAVDWGSFFEGSYRFERTRDQLSGRQLSLLGEISTIDPSSDCTEDTASATIVITDAEDEAHTYRASEEDKACGSDDEFVDYDALDAFLATASCLASKSYDASSLEVAPHVAVGDGCEHGVFSSASDETLDWWFWVDVEAPGALRIATVGCRDRQLRVAVLDADAAEELASAEGTATQCPALEHTFPAEGSYPVHLRMTAAGMAAGDFGLTINGAGAGREAARD